MPSDRVWVQFERLPSSCPVIVKVFLKTSALCYTRLYKCHSYEAGDLSGSLIMNLENVAMGTEKEKKTFNEYLIAQLNLRSKMNRKHDV